MQKRIPKVIVSFTIAIFIMFLLLPIQLTTYAEIAEGYYEISNADSDSVSIATDYFDKPATFISGVGDQGSPVSINQNKWMLGLQTQPGDNEGTEDVPEDVLPSGMNAGTLIVIVLLTSITVILLYAFVFKSKK